MKIFLLLLTCIATVSAFTNIREPLSASVSKFLSRSRRQYGGGCVQSSCGSCNQNHCSQSCMQCISQNRCGSNCCINQCNLCQTQTCQSNVQCSQCCRQNCEQRQTEYARPSVYESSRQWSFTHPSSTAGNSSTAVDGNQISTVNITNVVFNNNTIRIPINITNLNVIKSQSSDFSNSSTEWRRTDTNQSYTEGDTSKPKDKTLIIRVHQPHPIPYPVRQPIPYKIPVQIPYPVRVPVPIPIHRKVPVPVPVPQTVPVPVPVGVHVGGHHGFTGYPYGSGVPFHSGGFQGYGGNLCGTNCGLYGQGYGGQGCDQCDNYPMYKK